MTNSSSRPDEFSLIAGLFAPLAGAGAFGLKDDAAVIAPAPGHELVVTTDVIIASVDFFAGDPADTVAKKALRVNLSDLAAKGAEARSYLLTLSLPAQIEMAWLESFARGLAEDQAAFGISLLGGDISGTPGPLSISVTAFGEVPAGQMIRRGGAQAGDFVFVTGTIGDSAAGLAVLKQGGGDTALIQRYRVPEPPVRFGPALRGLATAALDVSDGLVADLGHLAEVSGVGVEIDGEKIPLSPAVTALWGDTAFRRAAVSGDDYEIAFTARPDSQTAIAAAASRLGITVTQIGRVTAGAGVRLLDGKGQEIPVSSAGFRHF